MPLNDYTQASIENIAKDPLYKQFMEFKNEAIAAGKRSLENEKHMRSNDGFKYENPDPYFDDFSGDSWNDTPVNWNMKPGF